MSQYKCPTVPDRGVLDTSDLVPGMWDEDEELGSQDRKGASQLTGKRSM